MGEIDTIGDHTLDDKAPTEEVLLTVLLEVEHMVNSRPLTHVSVDPRNEEALTPNHLSGCKVKPSVLSRPDKFFNFLVCSSNELA